MDIKLKNKQNQEVTLHNVEQVTVPKADGTGNITLVHPDGNLNITDTQSHDVTDKATVQVVDADLVANNIRENVNILGVVGNVHEGITPSGNVDITGTSAVNVTNYATAQINDPNLVAENIAEGVTVLGITGTHSGGGGSGPTHYVTFTAAQANSTIALTQVGTAANPWQFVYSTDNTTWQTYTIGSTITLTNVGDYVSFAGVSNWARTQHTTSSYNKFLMSGQINGSGDCNALYDSEVDYASVYCCYKLFSDCTSLLTAPEFPATQLFEGCYSHAFYGCTSLITPPALPSTNLAIYCYDSMFNGCTSLISAVNLQATQLVSYCYRAMYYNCTSLVTTYDLPASRIASYSYYNMYFGCTSLVVMPAISATYIDTYGCFGMFRNCTSLSDVSRGIAATACSNYSLSMTFYGCTSLTESPIINFYSIDATYCLNETFGGCTNLSTIRMKCLKWDTSKSINWVYGVASSGTFYINQFNNVTARGASAIPENWTVVTEQIQVHPITFTAAEANSTVAFTRYQISADSIIEFYSVNNGTWQPYTLGTSITLPNIGDTVSFGGHMFSLSAINNSNHFKYTMTGKLNASGCIYGALSMINTITDAPDYLCYNMFYNCTSLLSVPDITFNTIGRYTFYSAFYGSGLLSSPNITANDIGNGAFIYAFLGCSSMTSAGNINVRNIGSLCFSKAFQNCTSLQNAATFLNVIIVGSQSFEHMYSGCSSLIVAANIPFVGLESQTCSYMYENCTSLVNPPIIYATSFGNYSCEFMFSGCESLISMAQMPNIVSIYQYCFQYMYQNCISLIQVHDLTYTIPSNYCYYAMLKGCTSLVNAPKIYLSYLSTSCMTNMLYGCSSLQSVYLPNLTVWNTSCTDNWLYNVPSGGTFNCKSSLTGLPNNSWSGNPGWTRVDI